MARDAPSLDSFGPGGFRVSGVWRPGSLLIVSDVAVAWPVRQLADVTPDSLYPVFAAGAREVEFLLLGTGAVNGLPPRPLRDLLQKGGIGLEYMDTAAASRLYNVLTAQGRRLACALIAM
ncbi:MAG: MTH938/NDUFAF3 family protein [Phenylobacterium sp.]|uniref:Mth938-like domain-containing protein n=1 Tax=Phenylobacterium sp. TaxID=1871053 RepID=UPI0027193512|nr:MTH938/NDUFAF3 family protein [Phenylobacterium sp.]MDO8902026.1 MTH938/NDUFAF3 family protein [Phenylobacterium sp.]MDP2212355.1 MTH938/NDUFAF3 family protein [Phenylobacterium sp.]